MAKKTIGDRIPKIRMSKPTIKRNGLVMTTIGKMWKVKKNGT